MIYDPVHRTLRIAGRSFPAADYGEYTARDIPTEWATVRFENGWSVRIAWGEWHVSWAAELDIHREGSDPAADRYLRAISEREVVTLLGLVDGLATRAQ